jgi:D-alanine-D-alanine ligase-like ATP-grasp enzyme
VYEGIVERVKMYDVFVTIKMPFRIARVDIMKTEDAIRIIEINEPPVFLVSSAGSRRRY